MKRTALILSLASILLLTTACGNNGDSSVVSFVKPESEVGSGVDGDETMRLPGYELTDKKVTMLTHYDSEQNSVFKDTYGGELERIIVPSDQVTARFQQLVNSDTPPDLLDSNFIPTLVTKGYVQPLDEYIDFSTPLWSGVKESHEKIRVDGKLYMIDPMCARYSVMWYNKTIFKNAGLKNPGELLAEGNWNWDTYRDAAIKLTTKGADGNVKQWGTAIDTLEAYIHATGKGSFSYEEGNPVNCIKSNEISRAMSFLIDLSTKDNCVYPGGDSRDQFAQGKIAMVEGHVWYRDPLRDMLKNGDIAFVPTAKDPESDQYYIMENFGSSGFYIPKGAKNVTGAAAYICSIRYSHLDKNKQKETFDKLAAEVGWTQECEDMLQAMQSEQYSPVPNTMSFFDLGEYYGDIFARPKDGEPWATIAEELAPKIDGNIEKAYAK